MGEVEGLAVLHDALAEEDEEPIGEDAEHRDDVAVPLHQVIDRNGIEALLPVRVVRVQLRVVMEELLVGATRGHCLIGVVPKLIPDSKVLIPHGHYSRTTKWKKVDGLLTAALQVLLAVGGWEEEKRAVKRRCGGRATNFGLKSGYAEFNGEERCGGGAVLGSEERRRECQVNHPGRGECTDL
eukprot:scaffold67_cov180-Ochromonas_danica.AAC.1